MKSLKLSVTAFLAVILSGCGTIGGVDDVRDKVVLLLSEITVGELQNRCSQQYVNEYGRGDLVEIFSAPPFDFEPLVGHQLAVAYDCGTIPLQPLGLSGADWIDDAILFARQYAAAYLAAQCQAGGGRIEIEDGEVEGIRFVVYDRCPA